MRANVPPHNLEAEKVILGACLLGMGDISSVVEKITPDVFYQEKHGVIYSTIAGLYQAGVSVDIVAVADELKNKGAIDSIGGVPYLAQLTSDMPVNVSHHCQIVNDAALKRDVICGFSKVVEEAYNGSSVEELVSMVHNTTLGLKDNSNDRPKTLAELIPTVLDEIEERSKTKNDVSGIRTGLTDLDRHMGGLQKSQYVVIAGRPGMGKTSLALKFINGVAKEGEGCLVFSLEMKDTRLVQRLIAMESRVEGRKLSSGDLKDTEWAKVANSCGVLSSLNVVIDHTPALSIAQMSARAKKVAMKTDIGMIVVDYITLMRGPKGTNHNRTRELTDISAGLLALAKELDVAIIVLSQLNRNVESRPDKRPMVSDLRESGAIEQDADVVLLLYRDELYNDSPDNPNKGLAEIIVGKGRDIGTRTIQLGFNGEITDFFNLAYDEQ